MNFSFSGLKDGAHADFKLRNGEKDILYVDIKFTLDTPAIPDKFRLYWSFPVIDCYSTWTNEAFGNRPLMPNWGKVVTRSRLASGLPMQSVISADGKNRMCISVSDAHTPITIATGVREETAELDCYVEFFTIPTSPISEYNVTVRLDMRSIPFYDSLYDTCTWWENECGYPQAYVPEYARLPMNSLWYSYHQQLDPDEIVRQCELSKPLGMDTVIIDDGWQTDDNNRGYAYCGDWEPTPSKIPSMKELTDRIHKTGMKVMLWFSVPFIGKYSKAYERFKDMLLESSQDWACADPRYKEVRDFLTETYVNAVKEWGLDGLKLDFIDAFALTGKSLLPDSRRDFPSLEDAIDALLRDITVALKAINPDILIEFRQSYIGPTIRKYGNMLRVGDCPNDAIRNRVAIVNMRFTSGKTPVHSDMLMWNYNDPVEIAALQLASILYSVPQISVIIDRLSPEHYAMLKHYLAFWREHSDILLDGKLTATKPENRYETVRAELDGRAVITVYSESVIRDLPEYAVVVNASGSDSTFFKDCAGREYRIVDCMGNELKKGIFDSCKISEKRMPISSMIFIK